MVAARETFRILTLNAHLWDQTAMLYGEPTGYYDRDAERLPKIIEKIRKLDPQPDMVNLQEVFCQHCQDAFKDGLRDLYPHVHATRQGPGFPGLIEQAQTRWPPFLARMLTPQRALQITKRLSTLHYEVGQPAALARYLGAIRAGLPVEDLFTDILTFPFRDPQVFENGLLMLSRHPLEEAGVSLFPMGADFHKFTKRKALHAKVRLASEDTVLVTTFHCQEGHSAAGVRVRKRELDLLRQLKISAGDAPVIFAGDMNVIGEEGGKSATTLEKTAQYWDMLMRLGLIDAYRTVYPDIDTNHGTTYLHGTSFAENLGVADARLRDHQRIDYILHNQRWRALDVLVLNEFIRERLSDHAGLLGVLELAA